MLQESAAPAEGVNMAKRLIIDLAVDLPMKPKVYSTEVLRQRVLLAIEAFRNSLIETGIPVERIDAHVQYSCVVEDVLHGEVVDIEEDPA